MMTPSSAIPFVISTAISTAISAAIEPASAMATLAALAARATLVLGAAALATLAMKRASAATRHLVWSGALAGVLLLPFLDALLPAWRLLPAPPIATSSPPARVAPRQHAASVAPTVAPTVAAAAGARRASLLTVERRHAERPVVPTNPARPVSDAAPLRPPRRSDSARPAEAAPSVPATSRPIDWQRVAVALWLAGLALLLVRLVAGTLVLRRVVRRTVPIDDERTLALARRLRAQLGIRRSVRVVADARATVPMTWGIAAPIVVLPAESGAWSDARRRLVLAHEMAHVARMDGATQLVAQLAAAIFWFHPLVWLALRALRHERERACDDLVLTTGTRASDYARDLVELATRLAPSPATVAAFGMARRSELEGRVLAILDPRAVRGRAGWRAASLAVTGAAALTLAAATVGRREAMAAATRPTRHAARATPADDKTAADASASRLRSPAGTADGPATDTVASPETVALPTAPLASAIGAAPAPPVAAVAGPALGDTVPATAAPTADRATLLMVADAAKRISSDAEKSTLLQAVYPRYRADDGLREAYLGVVATLTSDNARAEALLRVARRDTLSAAVLVQAIGIAAATTADYEQGRALQALAAQPALADPRARRAFFDATMRMSSSTSEGAVLAAVLRRSALSDAELVATMQAAAMMSSTPDAATVLVAVVRRHPLDDDALRTAFVAAAGKLQSDTEYRRVMTAAAISF